MNNTAQLFRPAAEHTRSPAAAHTWAALILMATLLSASISGCKTNDATPQTQRAAPPTGYTEDYAQVNGVSIHYLKGGQGDPVVLLHGWPQTWYEWNRIMPQLAQQYTVIVPDLRGSGESGKPQPPVGYDTRNMAEDIHQLVQKLGYKQIKLVGHDIGLMVSYAYAAAYPNEIQKLVLLDAPIPGIEPVWSQLRAGESLWHFGFQQVVGLPEDLTAGREREYLTWFYTNFAANKTAFTEAEVNEYVRAYSAPGAMSASFESYRAFPKDAEQNLLFQKTRLTMPVLAMGGQYSLGPLMLPMLQAVANNVEGGIIPGCGHWITEEKPDYLLQQLTTFFKK